MKIKKIIIIAITFLNINYSYSQVKINNYSEHKNWINIEISLMDVPLLSIEAQNNNKLSNVFYDLSKPGEYALPSKNIFVAIPQKSKVILESEILKSNRYKYNLGFNPKPILLNDSTTFYTFKNLELKRLKSSPIVELLGYSWIDNIYCAQIKINQYSYDERKKEITEIEKIALTIKTNSNFFKKHITNNITGKSQVSKAIINYRYANKFIVNRAVINDSTFKWIDLTKDYLKIGTAQDGIYRITKNDLEKFNISVAAIQPQTFKLFLKGKEIPIYVKGESDGTFNNDDYIEFFGERNMGGHHREVSPYGKPYNEYLGRYTDTTVYWLVWDGDFGKRVKVNSVFSSGNDTLEYYDEILHQEKNPWFDSSSPDQIRKEKPYWTENKTWVWGQFKGGTVRSYRFDLTDIYPGKTVKLFAKLQSFATQITNDAHLLALSINSGNIIGDTVKINKYQKIVLHSEINSDDLVSGRNYLKVHSFPTSSAINLCLFDWVEMEYPRYLKVIDDSLNFQFPFITNDVIKGIKIINITSNGLSLWKKGKTYEKYQTERVNNTIYFSDTLSTKDKFIITKTSKIKSPFIYYKKKFKNLRGSSNKADYIAITQKKFIAKVKEYSEFIAENYNVKSSVIDIDDIYDEFAYGFFNPEAIKDFLKMTHQNWQVPYPKYVNLIGDATYDYFHNKEKYLGLPHVSNYVPSFGAPVSDNWFVMWNSLIPQMNIGRLPVKTISELERYFNRHKTYIKNKYDEWNKNYLFFSGGKGDSQSELNLLSSTNKFIIKNYILPAPIGGNVHHFYKTINPTTNFGPFDKDFVKNAIQEGSVFISYIGHSGTRTWDNSITEPEHLNNTRNRSPLVTDYGCSTGKFAEPDITSYAELFLLAENSQGIAYIGNSSLGFTTTAVAFPKLFYKQLLSNSIYNISEALKQAKIDLLSNSSRVYELFALTNTLIGDPIISLPIPKKPNLVISSKGIEILSKNITDADQFVKLRMIYKNLGKVTNDSVSINLQDKYEGTIIYKKLLNRKLPLLNDTLTINIPIKNKPGNHQIDIQLDYLNKIDEIYENDNQLIYSMVIASSSTRTTLSYKNENTIDSVLLILSPSAKPQSEQLMLEIADNSSFNNSTKISSKIDTFFSKIYLNNLSENKRFWVRSKLKDEQNFSSTQSFSKNSNVKYLLNDSLTFTNGINKNVTWNKGITLDTASVVLSVSSAGFYEGRSALIFKNDTNFVPQNYKTGHHIVLFDKDNYTYHKYLYFNTYSGGTTVLEEYKNFLDTLSNKYLIFIAVSDDGRVRDASLRDKLKAIGSKYIDSLKFRSSWAIIGHKGATPGSVPEAFSNPTEGSVKLDTVFKQLYGNGNFLSNEIGPATNWKKLIVNQNLPNNSKITYVPIGITKTGLYDTLTTLSLSNSEVSLKNIDAQKYPKLKILANFNASTDKQSPILNSLGVDYDLVPELGTNYQVVSLLQDSVQQGENVNLKFYVYNVGESAADSFKVKVDVIHADNSREKIFEQFIDSLGAEKRKLFNVSYNTVSFSGRRTFAISIDPENKVPELFEDNNFYNIPFYVKGDTTKPSLNITFNGNELFDGEYISATPKIKIEMNDPSLVPVTDTSAVSIFLNNKLVPYKGNEDILSINYSQTNPKVVVNYTPNLENGEYRLIVFGKDASGNVVDSTGISKSFIVQTSARILNIYNYPNPMTDDTYFTFKLTQIPDEVKIRIFTIAGRMIKEIKLNNSELHYDLNKIYWDGRDNDGDEIANGTYLYKVIMSINGRKYSQTKKLAIVK